ncbi:MAG: hypothetical protein WBF39_17335 [Planococcus donghaensis]
MEFSKEVVILILGIIGGAAVLTFTISLIINKYSNVSKTNTKTSIKQKGDKPQAFVNSEVNYNSKNTKDPNK